MSWPEVPLEELAVEDAPIVYGILKPGPNTPGGIPYVRPTEMGSREIRLNSVLRTTSKIAFEFRRSTLRTGDLVLSIVGTIGKIAFVPPELDGGNITQCSVRIRSDTNKVDARYLSWALESPRVRQQYDEYRFGSGVPRLNVGHVRALKIPLPPLAEQRRIADILDTADAIRRKRRAAIALTEELLRSAFLEMFGDPVTNPKGWNQEPLGAIADIVGGGTPSRAREDFYEGTIPWATAKDFRSEMMATTQEHVSDEAISESATKLVAPGTILVVVKSKILMRRLPVAIAAVQLCFNQDVKGIVVRYPWESTYLAAHLRMAQRLLLKLARGVNTEGLTIQHLRTHAVMRPPEKLVRGFAQIESALRRTIEREAVALSESENLFNGLVHRAFRGALDVNRPESKSKTPATSSETR